MQRFPRPLLGVSLLATSACSADAIAGPEVAAPVPVAGAGLSSRLQAVKAGGPEPEPEPAPGNFTFRCGRLSPPVTEPLYIVDGAVRPRSEALARFDTGDVTSIQLLEGPDAAALYGSRAALGVVVISTRNPRLRQAGS